MLGKMSEKGYTPVAALIFVGVEPEDLPFWPQ